MASGMADVPAENGMAPPHSAQSPDPPQWYEHKKSTEVGRSVTPAMNNTRGSSYASSPLHGSNAGSSAVRSGTPTRYLGAYNSPTPSSPAQQQEPHQHPSSTGLIRLTLRKPMGIVFEPMYDPNNHSVQRGVRICDLPRTGAAALSRKLEIGDELLSINDKTMSRLTFDEIMDFIIEADPDSVNLLFRRPRGDSLAVRQTAAPPTANTTSVKWIDEDDDRKGKEKKKPKEKRSPKRSAKRDKEEDDTIQSVDEESTLESLSKRSRGRRKDPYESESFLDLLIDSLCSNPDSVCRERNDRRRDDEYYSDEDTFNSMDDSTYMTYESEPAPKKSSRRRQKGQRRDETSSVEITDSDTMEEVRNRKARDKKSSARSSPAKDARRDEKPSNKPYEDDGTLETAEQMERLEESGGRKAISPTPLGLEPEPEPERDPAPAPVPAAQGTVEAEAVAAPISELEYDERFGADVSVMDSLGGPSLLIEKQRRAAAASGEEPVPAEIVNNFGKDFPADFGLTREQTAQRHPMKFYTHVVKALLQDNEPEKVRLLDKLLAKYKGREDHLVQKLNVRYNKTEHSATPTIEEEDGFNFSSAVNKTKESAATAAAVQTAKERMSETNDPFDAWAVKDEKAAEEFDNGSESESGSEFSGDSIDGTSPAVIAQVSELLNYVYGKTSVPGQIDRVSTIMRAYEGREAVLLELLETKALIKANGEKENVANLPSFLRNSPQLQANDDGEEDPVDDGDRVSPLSNPNVPANGNEAVVGTMINDDVSSMSGVSSPADENGGKEVQYAPHKKETEDSETGSSSPTTQAKLESHKATIRDKKKKKGIFGGLFGGRKKGKDPEGTKKGLKSPKGRKLKNTTSIEGSI